MNTTLLWLLLLPVVLPVVCKFAGDKIIKKDAIPWQIVAIAVGIGILLTIGMFYAGKAGKTWDIEILNGQVTGKEKERVSCSHSYSCNCRTVCSGSGSSRSCSTQCDTCYEHLNDWDWNVHSTVGTFTIDRIDRRGSDQPPRWTIVANGQPVAMRHSYTNYVKAVPESVFHFVAEDTKKKFANLIPPYPEHQYDYHYVDRVLAVGVQVPDLKVWNHDLALTLRPLGPQKQANVIVIFVKTNDPTYEYALRDAWLGGKKNDIIVMIGSTEYPTIDWVRVMSWSKNQMFNVQLRDDIQDIGKIDRIPVMQAIMDNTVKLFERKRMREFQYLDAEIDPPDWLIILLVVVLVAGNVGCLAVIWHDHNKWNGATRYSRGRTRSAPGELVWLSSSKVLGSTLSTRGDSNEK